MTRIHARRMSRGVVGGIVGLITVCGAGARCLGGGEASAEERRETRGTGQSLPIKYSSPNETLANYRDATGRQLSDGIRETEHRDPKTGKRTRNLVIYTGGRILIDVNLGRTCRVSRVVAHCTRPNNGYQLASLTVLAKEQGHWIERGSAPGFWGPTEQRAFAVAAKDLNVTARELRLQFATRVLLAVTEIEIFGRPLNADAENPGPARIGGDVALINADQPSAREQDVDRDNVKEVVLENRFVRLIVDPVDGAVCKSLLVKRGGKELVFAYGGEGGRFGLFRDQLWDPYYFFAERVYSHRIEQHHDRASVELWTTGAGGMMGFTEVRKTITIYRDTSRIRADFELKNQPSSQTNYIYAWWFHNFVGVLGERTTYFFPTRKGLATYVHPDESKGNQAERWYYDPARSWTGFVGESGAGLGIDVDNTYLNCFYHWAGPGCLTPTLEWRFNRVELPAGGELKTTTFLYPCHGMKRMDGAFNGLVAGLDLPAEAPPAVEMKAELKVAAVEPMTVDCLWRVRRLPGGEYAELKTESVSLQTDDTKALAFGIPTGKAGTIVVNVRFVRQGKVIGAVERPVAVGGVRLAYLMKPEGERLGMTGPKARPTVGGHQLSTEVETPHVAWAKPYARGTITGLFVTGEQEAREIIELWQRLDLDFTYTKFLSTKSDRGYLYAGDRSIRSLAQAQARFDESLKKDYDVIVISGMKWDFHFTDAERRKILEKVSRGTGLVIISPFGVDDRLGGISCFAKNARRNTGWGTWRSPSDHFITSALPWDVLPRTRCLTYEEPPEGDVLAEIEYGRRRHPLIVTSGHGKGRVVAMNYDVFTHVLSYMGYTGLTPMLSYRGGYVDGRNRSMFSDRGGENPTMPYHYWEYYYALLARAATWAAQKEPPVQVVAVRVTPADLPRDRVDKGRFEVVLRHKGKGMAGMVEATFRDRHYETIATRTVPVNLGQGDQSVRLDPPSTARSGVHFLDVIVRDAQGRSAGWGAGTFRVVARLRITGVNFARTEIRQGEPLVGAVKLEGKATGKERLRLELWDAYDRHIATRTKQVSGPKDLECAFEFKPADLIVPGLKVKATLRDAAGQVLDTASGRALAIQRRNWKKLSFISWGGMYKWRSHYLFPAVYKNVQELGLDVAMNGTNEEGTGKVWDDLYHGIRWCPLGLLNYMPDKTYRGFMDRDFAKKSSEYAKTKDKKNLVRTPCLHDPAFRKAVRDRMTWWANLSKKYGFGYDYCMGDEMSLTSYTRYHDYCFGPHTLAAFRKWLQKEYGDLAALNKEWGTKFQDWAAVMPMTADEVRGRGNYAPWADHRTFMEVSLADFYAMIQSTLRSVDPQARAGLSGTQAPVAGNGMDWWRLSKAFSFYHTYNTGWSEEMRRAFHKSTGVMTAPYYAGYWGAGRGLESRMWYCLLHDTASISAWTTRLFFYGDLAFSESGRDTRDYLNELKDGIWDLIRNAERLGDGIAVHYSHPSVHGAFILGKDREFAKTRDAWVKLLHDLGVQFDFIAYAEVEQGLLRERGYRVLILPESVALSEKEAVEIEAFVRGGGTVIADNLCALMNDRCRTLPEPRLDALFGVRHGVAGKKDAKVPDGIRLRSALGSLNTGTEIKLTGAEPGLAPTTAKPLAESAARFPVLLVNETGRGRAIYLNMSIAQYADDRVFHSPAEAQLHEILRSLLARAGAAPKVTVTYESKRQPHCEIVRYADGQVEYVGIIAQIPGKVKQETAHVRFGRRAHVYDARARKSLGETDSVTAVLESGQAKLYSLVPAHAAARFSVALMPAAARAGDRITFRAGPRPAAQLAGGVLHVEFVKPSGKVFRPYCSNHILKPDELSATGAIRLALNDETGNWTVRARDVATGTTAEATLHVRPPE